MVWRNGTGHASFQLNVKEGKSEIQLGFSLGNPDDAHLLNLHQMPKRQKSPRQQERYRKRAAMYQARMQSANSTEEQSAVPAVNPSEEPSSESDLVDRVESQAEVEVIPMESLPDVPVGYRIFHLCLVLSLHY